ncbi:hypothetical protein Glove_82g22 [Diversispora epigaea]|uniref:Uncharacterized protein n=1 Tax=Diversispora epigaea TaxID=1348612 RepID=A0A397JGQ9_9GLOM|nr:hypothetical protein Glove_82g22 [Diversispora epigaea]
MSDLNQLFKRKNQPSLRTNLRPSSSFSSSSSFSRPILESEDSGLTGLTGSTGLTSRNNDATTKRIFSKLDNLQKMLEKIMKNQEKMQNDIKSVKEEVPIFSYDQDCVYSVILESAQDLLEKIIYPTLDQFKETAKSFMEKSDINFFSSLGHRWEPFYHKRIQVDLTKKLRALRSTLCARVKTSIFEVCKVPLISIVAEASKISAWKKNPAISNSFRKLFDKVKEDEEDTYITRIIKNVWPKKKIFQIYKSPGFEYEFNSPERLEVTPKRLAASKKSAVPERPAASRSNKRITEIETSQKEKKKIRSIKKDEENDDDDDEADEGVKAYEANEAYETDEGDEYYNEIINIDEKVTPKRLAASKKSAVPERPAASRSNKRITEIETSQKEKKKIRSIKKDEENDDDDDEADEGVKAYEANEAYETDEGDEYYNEIINIDESEEE